MLRKKNYKQQQHFSRLYSCSAYATSSQTGTPTKHTLYFKRYRQNNSTEKPNLYNLMNKNKSETPSQKQQQQQAPQAYPKDRTLELMCFDGSLDFVGKLFRKIGKIRKIEQAEAVYKGAKIWTAIIVFKFQFDLVKCFREDYLQSIINEQTLTISKQLTEEDRQQNRIQLIHKHMGKQLSEKVSKLQKMQQDGFSVVTDIYGQYRLDYEANQKWVQNLPQNKKKQKQQKQADNINEEKQQ